ncbi:MAG: NAD(P)/FAD-dependent oxidoreductase [Salinivirgaceae bacterium]|jgi:NAD(P)H-nitrite reductase large subunit
MEPKATSYTYIIVGAGIAGISAIKKIRELDLVNPILLISDEDRMPYKRTKINKSIATGFEKEAFQLYEPEWYLQNNVELCFAKVYNVFLHEHKLLVNGNTLVTYQKLLLATGSIPIYPAIKGIVASDNVDVHFARNVAALIQVTALLSRFLIIGGSVEGLETANQLSKMGKTVTVVERSMNPLSRFFPEYITSQIYDALKKAGVTYLPGTTIAELVKTPKNTFQLINNQKTLEFDRIIVCAGTRPNTELAQKACLDMGKGVLVNEFMQTSNPDVFAAGDVAQHPNGEVTGLWHSSEFQGFCAGTNMVELGTNYQPVPTRLKTNLFGGFYFSANFNLSQAEGINVVKEEKGTLIREFYIKDGLVVGLVMANDKERDKLYQKAVAEKWTMEEVFEKTRL